MIADPLKPQSKTMTDLEPPRGRAPDEDARRDMLRRIAAMQRGEGVEIDIDAVPARWSVVMNQDVELPGSDRRIRLRYRVAIGVLSDIEGQVWDALAAEAESGVEDRGREKAIAKQAGQACRDSDACDKAKRRVTRWVDSVIERAAALGDAWKPRAFIDEMAKAAGFGGRIPRLQALLDALEETFAMAAARAGVKVRREKLENASGLGVYLDGFPAARAMIRKLRLFVGPTNSGKTHAAMDRLAETPSGCYLAPLRLLALEGQEAMETRGRMCSLITGEERDVKPGADFVSSTIEMVNVQRIWGCVVVDEIQMIGDHDRGWAWTQAVAGVAAPEVVMTGSPDAIPYVKKLADALGEELEIVEFVRKSPLRVQEAPVSLDGVKKGDAVIAFSRRDVMSLRRELLGRDHNVAVIYGALSPEVRRAEAQRFRDGAADVLVATDAIGMGLNLPVARVVLSVTRKYDGKEERDLNGSEIRQIGGRAGRFGMQEDGRVAVLEGENINPVRRALTTLPEAPEDPRPWISPNLIHVEAIAAELQTESLAKVLRTAGQELLRAHQTFRMTDLEDRIQSATAVDRAKLPLAVRDLLARCPIDTRDADNLTLLTIWARNQGMGKPNPAPDEAEKFHHHVGTDVELERAERAVKKLTSYAWLAYRFPDYYPEMDLCQERRAALNAFIERTLAERSLARACPSCGAKLKPNYRFRVCESCYAKRIQERRNRGEGGSGEGGRGDRGFRGPGGGGGKPGVHAFHHPQGGKPAGDKPASGRPAGDRPAERPAGEAAPKKKPGGHRKGPRPPR
jgi:ATP-dependent RNA helicase SUPV3L1/SUV3